MRQRNTSTHSANQFMSEYVPTSAKQTIRYAKTRAKRKCTSSNVVTKFQSIRD